MCGCLTYRSKSNDVNIISDDKDRIIGYTISGFQDITMSNNNLSEQQKRDGLGMHTVNFKELCQMLQVATLETDSTRERERLVGYLV